MNENSNEGASGARTPALTATLGASGLRVAIEASDLEITADEPVGEGGEGTGPGPFTLLYASLGSCVLMTLRMYAGRKGWALDGARLRVFAERKPGTRVESIDLELTLEGDLSDEQRARLLDIAGKCPVHRSLEHPIHIETRLVEA